MFYTDEYMPIYCIETYINSCVAEVELWKFGKMPTDINRFNEKFGLGVVVFFVRISAVGKPRF